MAPCTKNWNKQIFEYSINLICNALKEKNKILKSHCNFLIILHEFRKTRAKSFYSPLDDILVNEVRPHRPVHLMKNRFVGRLKRLKLPYHSHTSHHAYAHEPDATIQIDGYVDLFKSIPNTQKKRNLNNKLKWVS